MNIFQQISLRHLVPLVIILIAVMLSIYLYKSNKPEYLKKVEEDTIEEVKIILHLAQGSIETLLRYKNINAMQSFIASFGAEQGHELMYVTDAQGKIIATTKLGLLNKHSTEINELKDSGLITRVLKLRSSAIRLSEDKQHVFGYASICAGQDAKIIRPRNCGYLYYRKNIKYQKSLAAQAINEEAKHQIFGIAISAFLVWLLVYFRLTYRVEQLVNAGKKFTQGDRNARTKIKGGDELAILSHTFDTMFEKLVADEKALRKSEEHMRAIIDTSVAGIITIDQQGNIQSINLSARRLFGYQESDVLGRNVSMLMPPPYRHEHDDYIKRYIEKGAANIIGTRREVQGQRKDGSIFSMRLSIGEFYVEGQQYFTGMVEDITQLRESEKALRLTNAAVIQSRDAVIIIANEQDQPDYEIIFVNPAFEKITGFSFEEAVGKTLKIIQGPKTNKKMLKQLRQTLEKGKSWNGEAINYRKDGSKFNTNWNIDAIHNEAGEIINWVATLRDITKEKKSGELLRLREEEFYLIFENAPTGIAILDLNGNYTNVNPVLCDILGYSKPELLNLSYKDITHPDDIETSSEYLHKLLEGDFTGFSLDKRYIRKDKKIINVNLNVALVHESTTLAHDATGKPALLISHIVDITEEIKAEEIARSHQEELAHMDRLTTMGEMVAGIAHEINQPLTAIDSYAQAMQSRIQDDKLDIEKLQALLEKISKASLRAGNVISRVRAMVKSQIRQHVSIGLNNLIENTVEMAGTDKRAYEFRIKLELSKGLPNVMVDPVQIQQVLLNLIRNAMDAEEKEEDRFKEITICSFLSTEENRIEVLVRDYGCGVDKETADQLYNPFYTTKETGMGMGLSISKSIIQSHGGKLWFMPNSDKGTTFYFTLPTELKKMSEDRQIVFIIDDDEDVRDSLVELLESIGMQTKSYDSAINFLNEADLHQAGCILADVRMPGMSGIELQHKLNELGAKQPMIIMTGHGDITMAVQAMKDGLFEFLQKPFRDQELLDCLTKALEKEQLDRMQLERQRISKVRISSLTLREREVVDLVFEGNANKNIAKKLGISERTVELHRSHAMEKLGTRSVAELVKIMLKARG